MRIALGVEYEGWSYQGFQMQNHTDNTIQWQLENAISKIACEPISICCAGRTDAKVNATGQVIHFDTNATRNINAWLMGVNSFLNKDIAITFAKEVSDDFHARFSAQARRYRYIIKNTTYNGGILNKGLSFYRFNYNIPLMHECAQMLIGEHDFASFKGADEQSKSTCRNIHFINVFKQQDFIIFDIQANAFLNHMVRNIVGSLLEVGSGQKDKGWFKFIFDAKDRSIAGPTAHPQGLYLVDVIYSSSFGLPKREYLGPLWFK